MLSIKEFGINGLFGRHVVNLSVSDNRIILVGYNGIGKSTVLNGLYYTMSCQWDKLAEIEFDSIRIKFTRRVFEFSKADVIKFLERSSHSSLKFLNSTSQDYYERYLYRLSRRELNEVIHNPKLSSEQLRRIASRARIPFGVLRDFASYNKEKIFKSDSDLEDGTVSKVQEHIRENLKGRILYLPTYRRIEKDIKTIFPEIEDEIQSAMRRRSRGLFDSDVYVELVNFGMEDVHAKLREKMESLRGFALSEVSRLTSRYLRDVIRDEANTFNPDEVKRINEQDLQRIFVNLDESVLSRGDQSKILSVVEKIKNEVKIKENERYVAHYISYLIEVGEKISKREAPVKKFVEICNKYLYGKRFHFDSVQYEISIDFSDETSVKIEDLSSGEKQIVSLFAHLILEDEVKNYVLIDEPELSLSVDWQQKFLEDISNLDTCHFIGAVTHSPFVFENSMDSYAVDLLSCFEEEK